MAEVNDAMEFTSSQEQLEVAALVNRFVGLQFEDFDPDIHVEEARKIVKFLDPRIELQSNKLSVEYMPPSSHETKSRIRGATELGEIQSTIGSRGEKESRSKMFWGKQREYKISTAIVTKTKNRDQSVVLRFKHFLKHGSVNRAIGKFPPYWAIVYNPKSLELIGIAEVRSVVNDKIFKLPFRKQDFIRYIKDNTVVAWKAPENR